MNSTAKHHSGPNNHCFSCGKLSMNTLLVLLTVWLFVGGATLKWFLGTHWAEKLTEDGLRAVLALAGPVGWVVGLWGFVFKSKALRLQRAGRRVLTRYMDLD